MDETLSIKNSEKLWSGKYVLLILVNLLNGVAGFMTIPLVAKYAIALGADITLASTISGMLSLVALFACPFAGLLTDRINRKWLLAIANLGYGICLVLHAFVTSVPLLLVLRCIAGLFFSVLNVTSIAFSTTFIPRSRTGEGLGYVALAGIVAQAAGPALGLALLDQFSYSVVFIVASLFSFSCMATLLVLPYKDVREKIKKKFSIHDLFAFEFVGFMLLTALFSSGNGLVSTYLAIIADERGIVNISLFFTVYSICMIVLRPYVGKLLDKKGVFFILIPSIICAALGMVLIGLGYSLAIMILASLCKALGQGNGTPSVQAYAVKRLDKSRAGVATSTIQMGQSAGNALAPILGSFFVKSYGYETMFVGFGIFILVAGLTILGAQYLKDRTRKN